MVLPVLFSVALWSPRPHALLPRPSGTMALRSKPWFLTLVFEAPVPCKIYARLTLDSFHSRLVVLRLSPSLTMGFQLGQLLMAVPVSSQVPLLRLSHHSEVLSPASSAFLSKPSSLGAQLQRSVL